MLMCETNMKCIVPLSIHFCITFIGIGAHALSFRSNICYEGNSDIQLVNVSYQTCIFECQRRRTCASINYWRSLKKCVIHSGNVRSIPCQHPGSIWAEKSDWTYVSCYAEVSCC